MKVLNEEYFLNKDYVPWQAEPRVIEIVNNMISKGEELERVENWVIDYYESEGMSGAFYGLLIGWIHNLEKRG